MNFPALVTAIASLHSAAQLSASKTVQRLLSVRNWIIGAYIVEFEKHGEDRAAYGQRLIQRLAEALAARGITGLSKRNLHNCCQVTIAYPGVDVGQACVLLGLPASIVQTSAQFLSTTFVHEASPPHNATLVQTSLKSGVSPFPGVAGRDRAIDTLPWRDAAWIERLFSRLTFSHLLELSRIDEPVRRAFYELHCLKEGWSVDELQRQRDSLLYERVGLSENRDEILALARDGIISDNPAAQLRDPYVLEFLELKRSSDLEEKDIEKALIDHLQHFLLELGREFCFVDRQFRITVGNRHHHLDLLFFHRRLRCLVAIDLKLGAFQPAHAGQMRFYLNYLTENVALPDENPPVGILLCSDKEAEVVRFATAKDESLYVSRYLLELPSEAQLQGWLHEERVRIEQSLSSQERLDED